MRNFKSGMVEEAKKGNNRHGVLEILIFLALFIGTQIIMEIALSISYVLQGIKTGNLDIDLDVIISETFLPRLFLTAAMIIIVLLYTKNGQKRNLSSLGLTKTHALKDYLIGYLVGVIMFSIIVLILVITKNLTYEKSTLSMLPLVGVFFIGFLIQGASEEIALRGYLMNSVAARHNIVIAVIINSSIFGILHLGNSNVTILSLLNIILFGFFASIYALKFNNIWGICALHSAWNFVQGNIFGLEVSGNKANESLWHFKASGNSLFNGGAFGPEGGLITTLILLISSVIIVLIKTKRNYIVDIV